MPGAPADDQVSVPSVGTLIVRDNLPSIPSPPTMVFPGGGGEQPLQSGIDTRRLLHALRRRWLRAVMVGAALAPLAALPVFLFMPRGYEAVVWLRIRGTGGLLEGAANQNEYEAYRKTQLQLLRSPVVLNAALRRPGISSLRTITDEDDPVTWLSSSIQPVVNAQSEVLQIKLRAPVAEDAQKILNAVTQCYLDDIVNKDRQDRLTRRDSLEKKYKENQTELRSRKETFNELARTLGTRDSTEVATQRALLMDHLSALRQTLRLSETDLATLDVELAMRDSERAEEEQQNENDEEQESGEEMNQRLEFALSREPEVRELEAQIAAIDDSILSQADRSARGRNAPAVKRMLAQREQLKADLESLKKMLRPEVRQSLSRGIVAGAGSRREVALSPATLKVRRDALVRTIEETSKELEKVTKEVMVLGAANADLEVRRGEIEQLQRVTDQIGLQLESSSLDLTAPPRVTQLEEATVPTSSDFIVRTILSTIAGLLAMTVGAGTVLLVEYLRNRLSSPEEISQRVGLRVIGTLPWVGKSKRAKQSEYRVAECVDAIRTLILGGGRDAPKVIMITSPGEREGKSSLAANLAASIARADKRTLLLDGSLRNPSVHVALQLDPTQPGFSELLRGEATNNEVVQPTVIDGLFAVTAGNCDYAAINALSRSELQRIVREYRETFDHIVIDAGPSLAHADALIIGQQSDAAVISTMRDVSVVPAITETVDRLQSAGVRVMGCVVCGTREKSGRRSRRLAG